MDKTKELGTERIGKLLLQYSLPAVIGMIVNAIYNVVDRIFIGQYAGEDALAGLTVAFPVMMIIFAFSGLVGIGGAALLAIRLGERDHRGASQVFANTLGLGVIITGLILVTLLLTLEPILVLFGATFDILGYADDYMRIILYGFIFQMIAFSLTNTVRTEGRPMLAMIAMLLSAVANIVLDYIFIAICEWGVQGAALATILGQFAGLALLLPYYLSGKSVLRVRARYFIPKVQLSLKILSIGVASCVATLGMSISMIFLNRALGTYGGTAAITSLGAINSLYTLFIMPIMGLQQGVQPIIGYNYGAKQMSRVYQALKLGLMVAVIFSIAVFVLMEVFPETFIHLFLEAGSSTEPMAVAGLRIFILMLPVLCVNLMGVAFFQSIAQGATSMVLSLLRQLIFLIPAVLILPQFLGLTGVWLATPVSDGLSVVVTGIVLIYYYRKERRKEAARLTAGKEILEV
jgi:putative MATE family efflux protein